MMTARIEILDVTLRDGGYKTNFHFSRDHVRHLLTILDQSHINYVEVGYRNGSFKVIPNIGETGLCPRYYLEFCKQYLHRAKMTVILHAKNVDEADFKEMYDCGVQCVRIIFPMHQPALGFKAIELASKYNFEIFVNFSRASQFTSAQILSIVSQLKPYSVKGIYLADSNGSLKPDTVNQMIANLKFTGYQLGFHAHDNLFLAQANAIAAVFAGATYIDTSLFGFGKGAGNLRTEGFVSYLHSENMGFEYDISACFAGAEYVKSNLQTADDCYAKDMILSIFNLSQDDAMKLGEFNNVTDYYQSAAAYSHAQKVRVS